MRHDVMMLGATHTPWYGSICRWTLDNGLDVVFLPYTSAPVAAVELWYHTGSKDDPPGRRGLAHFLEHMMFLGTVSLGPDEHVRAVDRLGGQTNAFTEEDVTSYTNTVPAEHAELVIQLEAERMTNLVLTADQVEAEREIVLEERLLSRNDPMQRATEQLRSMMLPEQYSWSPGGTREDLERIDIDDLRNFYQCHYRPDNATLVVVGNLTETEVRSAVHRHFGSPGPQQALRAAARSKVLPQTRRSAPKRSVLEPAEAGFVVLGFPAPDTRHPDVTALRIIDSILGGSASSRLSRSLVREQQSALRAASVLWVLELSGTLMLVAAAAPGRCHEVEQGLLREIALLGTEPFLGGELVRARNQLTTGLLFEQLDVTSLALRLGSSTVLHGDPRAWLRDLDRIRTVSDEEIARVAAAYLREELSAVVVVPERC